MVNSVALISGVEQSDSVTCTHLSILFQILYLFSLLQSIEESSLCYWEPDAMIFTFEC